MDRNADSPKNNLDQMADSPMKFEDHNTDSPGSTVDQKADSPRDQRADSPESSDHKTDSPSINIKKNQKEKTLQHPVVGAHHEQDPEQVEAGYLLHVAINLSCGKGLESVYE